VQPPVEDLFERWRSSGDSRALAPVFDRTAPEVWRVARHLTGSAHEADDLLQATFLAAIEGAARWRRELPLVPWLLGILVNKLRLARRRERRERATVGSSPTAASSDPVADAAHSELRTLLRERLAELPELYRSVLVLQLEHGLSAAEVAHALGRPRATVRSQLHRGLDLLRASLPAAVVAAPSHGGRPPNLRAVRSAVLAAAGSKGSAASTALGAMTLMKKLLAVCVSLLLVGIWFAWPRAGGAPVEERPAAPAPVVTSAGGGAGIAEAAPAPRRTEVVVTPPPDTPTTLEVHARWADTTPASSMWVCLAPAGTANWFAQRWQTTDVTGVTRFAPVAPGEYHVRSRHGASVARVEAGATATVDLCLPAGVDLRGTVVDQDGRLLAGAVIVVGPGSESALAVARSDGNGAFFVRAVAAKALVAAFADGFSASQTVVAGDFADAPIELRLGAVAGVVCGRVLDADGRPLAGAWVAHGYADLGGQPGARGPAVMRTELTDDLGEFRLQAVPLGMRWPLHVGARGHATWRGEVRVLASDTPCLEVRLQRAVGLHGVVRGSDGAPLPAFVHVVDANSPGDGIADQRPSWARGFQSTGEDGAFAFTNLPAGELTVSVSDRQQAVASRMFTAAPGDELTWDPVLRSDLVIAGRVVDEGGLPLLGWRVVAHGAEGVPSPAAAVTGEDGSFRLDGCAAAPYLVHAYAPGDSWHQPVATRRNVRPAGEELLLQVGRDARPSCEIIGRLAAEQPAGVLSVVLVGGRRGVQMAGPLQPEQEFKLGPVPPGHYELQLQRRVGEGFGRQIVSALGGCTLAPGERHDLGRVGMPPLGELAIELSDAAGNPVPKAALTFALLDAPMGAVAVGVRDGRGSTQVAPGTYLPSHAADGLCIEHAPITVASGERTSVRLVAAASVPRKLRYDLSAVGVPMRVVATWHKHGQALRRQWFDFWREVPSEHDEQLTPGTWELELAVGTGSVQRVPILVTGDTEAPVVEIRVGR